MILVTGATGFIGRAVCIELASRGYAVRAAIRDSSPTTGLPTEVVQIADIGADVDWSSALLGIDAVVHLAARVHVMRDNALQPLAAFREVNVTGTERLARAAVAQGVKRFVYLSSIKVNGEGTHAGRPYTPNSMPAPIDPYGISKQEAEEVLSRLAKETGLEVVIIRPVLVYGPGVKANFLSMMQWLHRGIPLPLGAIRNQRSLVALDNLVDLIVTCLHHPNAPSQTFLVSDGQDLSTTELLRRMSAALGTPARLLPLPALVLRMVAGLLGKTDVAERLCGSLQVDISKTRELLRWSPRVSVDEALKQTARHFLANL